MASDVNRLFSMIKQADLPYQVFADDTATAALLAPEVEMPQFVPPAPAANEDGAATHAGLFRAYKNVEAAPVQRLGTPLADVFRRMAKR
jgi:hypothetical protein